MALITLDQILMPLKYNSGSGVVEFAADNFKSASFSNISIVPQTGSIAIAASASVYIVESGSLEGNPVDGGSF